MTTRIIIMAKESDSFTHAREDHENPSPEGNTHSFLDTYVWADHGSLSVRSQKGDMRICCNLGPQRVRITSHDWSDKSAVAHLEPGQFAELLGARWHLHEEKSPP